MNLKKVKTKMALIALGTTLGINGANAKTIDENLNVEQTIEETRNFEVMANNTTKLNSKTVKKHEHKYKTIRITYTVNKKNKTYIENKIKQCSCGKTITTKKTKKCQFSSWKYNNETKKDERVCKVTGYKETRKHKHNYSKFVKNDNNYEYKKCSCGKQKKFKHQFKKIIKKNTITYKCKNKKCGFSYLASMKNKKKLNHNHVFNKLQKVTSKYEYWKCKVKGCTLRKNHNLKTIELDDQIILKCQNSKCTYQKVKHTHKYTLNKVDSNFEYWACPSDNKQKLINHNLVNVKNQDGSTTVKCNNDGCNYSYLIKHDHTYNKLASIDDNYEYWVCPNDNYQVKKAHTIVESLDQNGDTLRKCSNPGCTYQKTIHNHQTNTLASVDDNYEYWKCPKDNYQITKAHNIIKTIDKAGNTILTCSNPGCTYHKEIAHQHEYTTFVKYDENYEYWACPYDEEQITKNHNLTSNLNQDGSTTYQCSTCDYEYTTHVHKYLTLASYDDDYEHWTCECEEEELRTHNLVYDHFDLSTFSENYRCTTCDYTKNIKHVDHKYQITRTDDNYEYIRCDICNQDTSRLHSFPDIGEEDGCKVTYHCTNPDCNFAKETEQHFYQVTNTVKYNGLNPDKCYTDTYTCQNCGDSYDQDIPHSLQTISENAFEKVEMCKNCSYEKTTDLIDLDLSSDNKIMDVDSIEKENVIEENNHENIIENSIVEQENTIEENIIDNSIVEDEIIIEEASLRMDKPLSLTRSLKR